MGLTLTLLLLFAVVPAVVPSDCHTQSWYLNPDAGQCVAPPPVVPQCYITNTCWFGLYPPKASYNTWIPGDAQHYTDGAGYPPDPFNRFHALGYQSGDAIWVTPATTQQMSYVMFRNDGQPPGDLPPTGRAHTAAFKATLAGVVP